MLLPNLVVGLLSYSGADLGFQVRGKGALKFFFWGISCEKSRFYAKKHIFPILGGACAGCAPPESAPDTSCKTVALMVFIFVTKKRPFKSYGSTTTVIPTLFHKKNF